MTILTQHVTIFIIKTFNCKETEKIFQREFSKKVPQEIQRIAMRNLWIPPSNHLEALKGVRRGLHSIRINKQWRICFKWEDGHAYNVKIIDYHK